VSNVGYPCSSSERRAILSVNNGRNRGNTLIHDINRSPVCYGVGHLYTVPILDDLCGTPWRTVLCAVCCAWQ
jgi:hypothetical protein